MDALLRRCGLRLTGDQLDQLWAYHRLLRRHDADLNLTRIRNFENMVVKLYADSMLPAIETTLPSPLLDLGSGPGMPGVPLKIFRPELHVLLAESRGPRIEFLKRVVGELGLPGLEVVERGIAADFDRPVAGVMLPFWVYVEEPLFNREYIFDTIEANVAIDDELFSPPPGSYEGRP
jgi:16S rRNA (guanine527-N7)-methyltransferase